MPNTWFNLQPRRAEQLPDERGFDGFSPAGGTLSENYIYSGRLEESKQ